MPDGFVGGSEPPRIRRYGEHEAASGPEPRAPPVDCGRVVLDVLEHLEGTYHVEAPRRLGGEQLVADPSPPNRCEPGSCRLERLGVRLVPGVVEIPGQPGAQRSTPAPDLQHRTTAPTIAQCGADRVVPEPCVRGELWSDHGVAGFVPS